ncbi:hypothetical protein HNR60_000682 [Rhodopseudomonas rhenobacensis]|uniref:Cellulose biosynthesis protein BcsQ n=1 Tax=Rhodopseudomonas rhenobacensis TaxID=87461 RepID=A0A7W8DXN8_9BRAD|nr:hypothetical protein [Rhodopseudomonas rhenobacensis]MBB5045947.1 hypothetical protein [Rhodopseudomonas rhenobacensis]
MVLRIYLVGGFNGGSGRTLTAALLAYGLHLQAHPTMLVRQTYEGSVSTIDPIETTLPLPCCDLMLPAPYQLPADLTAGLVTTIHGADARFTMALMERATAEIGSDGDVVVDLCCHERALNAAAIRDAAVILVPARASVPEIDWAVRSISYIRDTQRYRNTPVATLLATIAPESERVRQMALLGGMLRDCDPERDLIPGEPADIVVDVPFLDAASLTALLDERPIWRDPQLIERCRAFAAAVAVRADRCMTMLTEDADDL